MPQTMNWADYAILILIGLSMLLSLWRGFVREVISIVTWVLAFFLAFNFSDLALAQLSHWVTLPETPSIRQLIGFATVFVGTLFVGGIVNLLIGQLVDGSGLGPTDRMVGSLFGLARGVAIVALLVMLGSRTALVRDPWWQQSMLLPHFLPLAETLHSWLPPEVASGVVFR
ncbi:CvpA family protein [Plasticicumulans sp.]|uniref:CvpA family protein n=1 Tax=Plasticicumulans sp. TaxID=2307179 RepID=UPI002BD3711F|nr:CvpA family protein [Plasticicumulans sp.]MBS0601825.1 CvpA family protein [Pseudomonadota bacterium]HMW28519.1 CvpA family protein [Plasticicumulans sp.]HMW42713.1 CvpA family protein [Plasticicumulans sp.]HMX53696.1 CvpA family protein [Plasticicumulans sp.]HND98231.1 CvpA family protein [Plasticicumulans sp.]